MKTVIGKKYIPGASNKAAEIAIIALGVILVAAAITLCFFTNLYIGIGVAASFALTIPVLLLMIFKSRARYKNIPQNILVFDDELGMLDVYIGKTYVKLRVDNIKSAEFSDQTTLYNGKEYITKQTSYGTVTFTKKDNKKITSYVMANVMEAKDMYNRIFGIEETKEIDNEETSES